MASRSKGKTDSYLSITDDFRQEKSERQIEQTKTAYLTVGLFKLTGYITKKEYLFLLDVILTRFAKWQHPSSNRCMLMNNKHMNLDDIEMLNRLRDKKLISFENTGEKTKVWLGDLDKLIEEMDRKDREKYGE